MTELSLYQRMKAAGKDMSWYERSRSRSANAVPLDDQACSKYSIYLMRKDGSVWTLHLNYKTVENSEGKKESMLDTATRHKKVRDTGRTLPEAQYVCMHTKTGYGSLQEALSHSSCNAPKEVI